jgi:hypothetical protein
MKRVCHCVLVIASLVSFEGLSFAQTTALSPWTVQSSVAPPESSKATFALGDAILLDSIKASARTDSVIDADDSFVLPAEGAVAGIRLCHISHHPRDGMRAALHACPLVVADADADNAVSHSPSASIAAASRDVLVN